MFNIKKIEKSKDINKEKLNLYLRKVAMKSLIILKLIYPYIISSGVLAGALSLAGGTPFYRDYDRVPLHNENKADSLGNKSTISYYSDQKFKTEGTLTYTTKWNKSDNGNYERIIKEYTLNVDNKNLAKYYALNPTQESSLEELFGECKLEKKETKSKLTDEELRTPDVIEATLYSIDKNDVIRVRESVATNVGISIFYVIMSIVICYCVASSRYVDGNYTFKKAVYDWQEKNSEYNYALGKLKQRELSKEEGNV